MVVVEVALDLRTLWRLYEDEVLVEETEVKAAVVDHPTSWQPYEEKEEAKEEGEVVLVDHPTSWRPYEVEAVEEAAEKAGEAV